MNGKMFIVNKKKAEKVLNTKKITRKYNCFDLTGKRQRAAVNHPHHCYHR